MTYATDIPGAPFKIGTKVQVVQATDTTFDRVFLGRTGTVKYFDYECGCGQIFPSDPMIGVEFKDFVTAEFWHEELTED